MRNLCVLIVGLMLLSACATTSTTPSGVTYEGVFVPAEYVNKFEVSPVDKNALRYMRPGVDFAKYNKFMVDYVIFALAPNADYKGIDAEEMKTLADSASKALVDAIKAKYPVVSEPGPDVARVKFAIVDLSPSQPGLSAVTSVVPAGLAISLVKKGVTDEYAGGGMTKGEVMILDSMTNEVIGAGYANYSAKFTERFSKWGEVEEAFKNWGQRIADLLTTLKGMKK